MARGFRWLAVAAGVTAVTGCVSTKSSHYHTDPSGQYWYAEKPVPGVPVTLEVPTHLTLSMVKRYHYVPAATGKGELLKVPGKDAGGNDKDTTLVTYDLHTDFIKGKKIFLVDFKRPAAGTFKMGASIDKDSQYFTSLSHEVNDTTIETVGKQVNDLVKTVIPVLGRRTTNTPGAAGEPKLVPIDSLVATTILKLDDPLFEEKVREFLCCAATAAGITACGCDTPVGCPAPLISPVAGSAMRPAAPGGYPPALPVPGVPGFHQVAAPGPASPTVLPATLPPPAHAGFARPIDPR